MIKFGKGRMPKNKQFNYTPRHYQGKTVDNPFDFDSPIRRDRDGVSYTISEVNGKMHVIVVVTEKIDLSI